MRYTLFIGNIARVPRSLYVKYRYGSFQVFALVHPMQEYLKMTPIHNLKTRISALFFISIAWALFVAALMSMVD